MPPVTGPIASSGSLPAWSRELWARLSVLQWLKFPGVTAFIWLFFIAYFALLRNPVYPVTVMPTTWLDDWVGFSPHWLTAYLSLWFYVGFPPGLMLRVRELLVYGLWSAAMVLTGLACFYLWPTAVPPYPVDLSVHPGFATLQGVDAPGNACPSMHVAAAVYTAMWLHRFLRSASVPAWLQGLNWLWAAAIVYSTMAIKQHVAWDVLAGATLGVAFAGISLACTPSPRGAARV